MADTEVGHDELLKVRVDLTRAKDRQAEIDAVIESIRELGRQNGKVTVEELLSARDEGRRI